MRKVINPGQFNRKISIVKRTNEQDKAGFDSKLSETEILSCWAMIKTIKGYTLIVNNTDFEKAYTNFTIRYPSLVEITRDMFIKFDDSLYSIEYLNNIDEDGIYLEIQAKKVKK